MNEENRNEQRPGANKRASLSPSPALPREFIFMESPVDFRDPGAIVVHIPGGIRSKQKLFAIFADTLHFPKYFGWNWDAFEECLRDLSWLPPSRPIAIVHEELPFGPGGDNRGVYLAALRCIVNHWSQAGDRAVQVVMPASLQTAQPSNQ